MLLTIITINFNNKEGLEKTIQSVFNQTYAHKEYIVIDGGSTDGSAELILGNKKNIQYSISEPDSGPYDAMNKGIDKATGEYLLFLNSGDFLANNYVLENFVQLKPKEDLIYGDSLFRIGTKIKKVKMPEKLTIGVALTHTINHQAIFYSKRLFEKGERYDCNFKITADWVFTNKAVIEQRCSTRHIDLIIPVYDVNGISSDATLRVMDRQPYLDSFVDEFKMLLEDYRQLNARHSLLINNYFIKILLKSYKYYSRISRNWN